MFLPYKVLFVLWQVRVPTHEDGTCLFWEFATDNYDLGFGVYFEWTIAPSNQVSVHVSESSDEEDLEEEEAGTESGKYSILLSLVDINLGNQKWTLVEIFKNSIKVWWNEKGGNM